VFIEKNIEFSSIIGMIFWIVIKNQQVTHGVAFMTLGNQKWHGAAPSFIIRAGAIMVDIRGKLFRKMMDIRKIIEAMACERKYFKAASFSKWFDV
jgi:hypothetical protein